MPDLSKTTPRPWIQFKDRKIIEFLPAMRSGTTHVKVDISNPEGDANAYLICYAVNAHDDLVAALREAEATMSLILPRKNRARYLATLETIRAALAMIEQP